MKLRSMSRHHRGGGSRPALQARGRWFETTCAHEPAMPGRCPSGAFPEGRSIYLGTEPRTPTALVAVGGFNFISEWATQVRGSRADLGGSFPARWERI